MEPVELVGSAQLNGTFDEQQLKDLLKSVSKQRNLSFKSGHNAAGFFAQLEKAECSYDVQGYDAAKLSLDAYRLGRTPKADCSSDFRIIHAALARSVRV